MRNIKLTIEYDGTNYAGWQLQSNANTVQEVIERALFRTLKEEVRLIQSGRTDSGVHALGQVANFRTKSNLATHKIKDALNSYLPKDVVIKKAEEVDFNFHARYDTITKSYRYTILNRKPRSPLNRYYATFIPYPLDISSMQDAARSLVGRHDFGAFQTKGSKVKNSTRTIKDIRVRKRAGFIYIDIEADGFLYNMVRTIVGTLIEVGRDRLKADRIKKILKSKKRSLAGPTAPPQGLCLVKIRYK